QVCACGHTFAAIKTKGTKARSHSNGLPRISLSRAFIHHTAAALFRCDPKISETTAKNRPVERPHIRMPVSASTPPTNRHASGSTRSPYPVVVYVTALKYTAVWKSANAPRHA